MDFPAFYMGLPVLIVGNNHDDDTLKVRMPAGMEMNVDHKLVMFSQEADELNHNRIAKEQADKKKTLIFAAIAKQKKDKNKKPGAKK